MIFLWLFLPFVLVVNLLLPIRLSSFFLLAMSFIFYAWGEQEYIWLLLLSLIVNYAGALGMEAVRGSRPAAGTGPEATGTGAAEAGPESTGAGAAEAGPEATGAGPAGAGAAGEAAGAAGVTAGAAFSTASQPASGAGKHTLFTPDKLLLVLLVAVNLGFWVILNTLISWPAWLISWRGAPWRNQRTCCCRWVSHFTHFR